MHHGGRTKFRRALMRAYIELRADGTIVHASSEAAALVRSDPASLVGRREAELLPAEDAQALLGLEESGCDRFDLSYRKACASGSGGSGEFVQLRACRIRLSGGGWIVHEERATQLGADEPHSDESSEPDRDAPARQIMRTLALDSFRLLAHVRACVDVILVADDAAPPQLLLSPLALELLGHERWLADAPSVTRAPRAGRPSRIATHLLVAPDLAARRARDAAPRGAHAVELELRSADNEIVCVDAILQRVAPPSTGAPAARTSAPHGAVVAVVSNLIETAATLAVAGAPLRTDSLFARAHAARTEPRVVRAASDKASVRAALLARAAAVAAPRVGAAPYSAPMPARRSEPNNSRVLSAAVTRSLADAFASLALDPGRPPIKSAPPTPLHAPGGEADGLLRSRDGLTPEGLARRRENAQCAAMLAALTRERGEQMQAKLIADEGDSEGSGSGSGREKSPAGGPRRTLSAGAKRKKAKGRKH